MKRLCLVMLFFGLGVQITPAQTAGDKVLKPYTNSDVERTLRQFDPSFKKGSDRAGNSYWDFKTDKYKVRLTNYGKDLMLDAVFGKINIDTANNWNQTAKFSRAVLYDNAKGNAYSAVESNLDCAGGVTDNIVRQWVKRFGLEVKRFARYVQKTDATDKVYTKITPKMIERVMTDLNIKFRKLASNEKVTLYAFTNKDNYNLLLYLFGTTDLMISASFPETSLEKINKYNLNRQFVRAVLYQGKDKKQTTLESNLDCVAGVSTPMIRYFINAFDVDVRHFARELFSKRKN